MAKCPSCDAELKRPDWCDMCMRWLATQEDVASLLADVDEAVRGIRNTRDSVVRPTRPPFTPEYSRWREGPLSWGPRGRVVMTLVVVVPLALGVFEIWRARASPIAALSFVWLGPATIFGVIWLLDIWKRARVR